MLFLKSCAYFHQIIALNLGFKLDHHPNSSISSNASLPVRPLPHPSQQCNAWRCFSHQGTDHHLTYDMVMCFWGRTSFKDRDDYLCCSPPYPWVPRTRKAEGISSDFLKKSKCLSQRRAVRSRERVADHGLWVCEQREREREEEEETVGPGCWCWLCCSLAEQRACPP